MAGRTNNSLEAQQYYGPRSTEALPYAVSKYGHIIEISVPFTFDKLPYASTVDQAIPEIKQYSLLKESWVEIVESFAGAGTETFDFGIQETDGTEVDNDGLHAAIAIADMTAGSWFDGAGALIGDGLPTAGQIVGAASAGTVTAGRGRLVLRFIEPSA